MGTYVDSKSEYIDKEEFNKSQPETKPYVWRIIKIVVSGKYTVAVFMVPLRVSLRQLKVGLKGGGGGYESYPALTPLQSYF
jgi:hypothetical protein